MDDWVSSTELEAGCVLDLPSGLLDGTTFTEGSIERSLTDDARSTLDGLSFELGVEGEPVATGEAIGAVDVDAEATRDGRTGRGRVTGDSTSLGAPSIDLAAEDPQVVRDRRRPGPRFRPPCCSIPPRTGRRARPRGQARPSSSRSRGSTRRPGWKPDLSA